MDATPAYSVAFTFFYFCHHFYEWPVTPLGNRALLILTPHVVESLVGTRGVSIELSLFTRMRYRGFPVDDRACSLTRRRYKSSQSAAILCETRSTGLKLVKNGRVA
jgi:hypothetical protein